MFLRRSRGTGIALLAGGLLVGCTDGRGPRGETQVPTRIVVDPADFLGTTPCQPAPGAMRSYQVTLFDVTEDLPGQDGPFALPTSGFAPCEVPIAFQFVVPGHRYIARVAGFTQAPDALRQSSPGAPGALDADGQIVPPRWTTTCHGSPEALALALGSGDSQSGLGGAGGIGGASGDEVELGALAVINAQVPVRGCEPLTDLGDSPTGVVISLSSALVGLSCGDGADQVSSFSVEGPGISGELQAACGDEVLVAPLPPNTDVEFQVIASAAASSDPNGLGGSAGSPSTEAPSTWLTRCRARTTSGVLVPASCDPLTPAP